MAGNEYKLQMDLPPGVGVRRSLLGWMGYPLAWADVNPSDVEPPAEQDGTRQGTMDEAIHDQELLIRVNEMVAERLGNLQDPGTPCETCGWKGGFDPEGFCPVCGFKSADAAPEDADNPEDVGDPMPEEDQEQPETASVDAGEGSEEAPEGPETTRKARRAAGVA